MTGTTDDQDDPDLRNIDPATNLQGKYLVLSQTERDKGFVRPVRQTYMHIDCGTFTKMGRAIAETYARDPHFYDGTYCVACKNHFPIGAGGQFVWVEHGKATNIRVGT